MSWKGEPGPQAPRTPWNDMVTERIMHVRQEYLGAPAEEIYEAIRQEPSLLNSCFEHDTETEQQTTNVDTC